VEKGETKRQHRNSVRVPANFYSKRRKAVDTRESLPPNRAHLTLKRVKRAEEIGFGTGRVKESSCGRGGLRRRLANGEEELEKRGVTPR